MMYCYYDGSNEYIWSKIDYGAVFSRWMSTDNGYKYEVGDSISVWAFAPDFNSDNYENTDVVLGSGVQLQVWVLGTVVGLCASILL